jgi:hypothetical protein
VDSDAGRSALPPADRADPVASDADASGRGFSPAAGCRTDVGARQDAGSDDRRLRDPVAGLELSAARGSYRCGAAPELALGAGDVYWMEIVRTCWARTNAATCLI